MRTCKSLNICDELKAFIQPIDNKFKKLKMDNSILSEEMCHLKEEIKSLREVKDKLQAAYREAIEQIDSLQAAAQSSIQISILLRRIQKHIDSEPTQSVEVNYIKVMLFDILEDNDSPAVKRNINSISAHHHSTTYNAIFGDGAIRVSGGNAVFLGEQSISDK